MGKWLGQNQYSKLTAIQRFMQKVIINTETGCWDWQGTKHYRGYGIFGYNKRTIFAHRFSYLHFIGELKKERI